MHWINWPSCGKIMNQVEEKGRENNSESFNLLYFVKFKKRMNIWKRRVKGY